MSTGITPPSSSGQPTGEAQKRPLWKKKRFIIPAVIVAFFILMSAISGGQRSNNQALPEVTASPFDSAPAAPVQQEPATPAPAPPPQAAPGVGEAVTVDQGDGNVAKVTIVGATYGPQEAGRFMGAPENGGYLILDVLWETQTGTTDVNPLYFNAKSAEGRQGGSALGVDGQIGTAEVPAGDILRGNVASDVGPGPWIVTITSGFQEVARFRVVLP